jgi:hypothetical protein
MGSPTLGEADTGVKKLYVKKCSSFPERSKSGSSASQKTMGSPTLGESRPGGSGGVPPAKLCALFCFVEDSTGEADPGGLRAYPQKLDLKKSRLSRYPYSAKQAPWVGLEVLY